MTDWKTMVAVIVAAAVIAGPVWAQTSTPSDKDSKGTTGATGSTGATDTTKPADSMKPTDSMKSMDTMKSGDAGKADMGKPGKMERRARGGNMEQVKAAQQALKDKGHDPGMIDGRMGPKTQAAVKEFQKAEGLKETGRLDAETMTKLGVETRTGAAGASSPSASPATDKSTGPTGDKQPGGQKK
jgi:peptidoglycan hydrolase-like protein with peptidoglycan-binding domain